MTDSPAELSDHLGYWLRLLSNHVSANFARRLAGLQVSVPEWVALREIYGVEGLAPSTLARSMGVTKGAVSKLADRLAARGLLSRALDPKDGRGQLLSLTPSGRALVPRLAALADANEAEVFAALSPEQRATLLHLIRHLAHEQGLTSHPID